MLFVRNFSIVLINVFLTFSSAFASCDYLSRISYHIVVSEIQSNNFLQDSHFSSSSEELSNRVGPALSRNDLYLYSDRSYIFTKSGDILRETIFDKGIWNFNEGCIFLESDIEITWRTQNAKKLIAFSRENAADEAFLLGADRDLEYFEKNSKDDPEFMLLINSMKRVDAIQDITKKTDLMSRAWNPSFFDPN